MADNIIPRELLEKWQWQLQQQLEQNLLYGAPVGKNGPDTLYGKPVPNWPHFKSNSLNEEDLIAMLKTVEKAFNNFAFTERRLPMIHEIMEIVIGRIGLALADHHGPQFDSFSFYAKVKGRPE